MTNGETIFKLSQLVRYNILTSTTEAGSGHPSSSLSAVELMTTLFFDGFLHYDLHNPSYKLNDRVIFSKGHASPLLYSLYQAAGAISRQELLTLRKFDSVLEGHPTPRFKFIDVATGSLGQGLSAGLGMALGTRILNKDGIARTPRVWVLLGDSEMAEGQIWESLELAAQYKLNNLVAILDVNRLGQRGETMLGWNIEIYAERARSFGWEAIVLQDGHNLEDVHAAFTQAMSSKEKPVMIIAKTKKGKGVPLLEDQLNWHGKPLPKDALEEALKEVGEVDLELKGIVIKPESKILPELSVSSLSQPSYEKATLVATREAYGHAIADICKNNSSVLALDAETSNSTYAETVKKTNPEQFFEMFIAEQNMVSTAVGLSKLGFIPFISTFAAFLTRAFDQIRMAQYSDANIRLVGSHAGVSIGEDGSSQMALEDIAMARSILNSIVFYPSDAVSAYKLFEQSVKTQGIVYTRTTREKTPILYDNTKEFHVGGSHVLYQSITDVAVIFAAGITLHEAVKAYKMLQSEEINVAVVDLYSVKPLDELTVRQLAQKTKHAIVVEDHYPFGGIGDAVRSALLSENETSPVRDLLFTHLAVHKIPRSGKPAELLRYEEIDAEAIVNAVKAVKR